MNENDALYIANTLRIAHGDLQAARLLNAKDNRNGAYLLEQAAEKIIRAVLTSEDKHGGIGHRLAEFVNVIPDQNPFKKRLREIQALQRYATSYRYPTPEGNIPRSPSTAEFNEMAAKVKALLDELVSRFGVDLAEDDAPAANPNPIR